MPVDVAPAGTAADHEVVGRPQGGRALGMLASTALGTAVMLLAVVLLGGTSSFRLATVDTGSMSPTMPAGTLLIEQSTPLSRIQVGQVVTYLPPGRAEEITHRVTARSWNGDHALVFRTRGDANPGDDPWEAVAVGPRIWVATAHVLGIGAVLAAVRNTVEQPVVLVVIVATVLIVVWGRRRGRRPPSSGRRSRTRTRDAVAPRHVRRGVTLMVLIALATSGLAVAQSVGASSAQAAFSASAARGHSVSTTGLGASTLSAPQAGCLLRAPEITLSWTSATDTRTGISIERKLGSNGTWSRLTTTSASATSYVDSTVASNSTYFYRLQHTAARWTGAYSNELSGNTSQVSCLI